MITSKLTSKAQTTIPRAIRRTLKLKPGDHIAYEIGNGQVILTRAGESTSMDDPLQAFTEWRGSEDEEAYADL